MFLDMAKNGWDTNSPMKWGFFFCDKEKDKLYGIFAELEKNGYTLEDIYQAEDSDGYWTMNTTKIDTLTAEKLHRRNLAFNDLADYCNVELYDGWDVERIKWLGHFTVAYPA